MNVFLLLSAILGANFLILYWVYRLVIRYKYQDPMTRLYNKIYLERSVKKWIKKNKDFTLCFFDIDHFKKLNDTYGHLAGDKGIIHLGYVLETCFKGKAIVARIGGDEFAVAFRSYSDKEQDMAFQSIRTQKYKYKEKYIQFTVSIGVCQSGRELPYEKLLEMADKKLYDSKKNRNSNSNLTEPRSKSYLYAEECVQ